MSPARHRPMVDFSSPLSRRERQVLEVILREGPAGAAEIRGALPGPPSHTLVRDVLTSLVRKGKVREERDGDEPVFRPVGVARPSRETPVRRMLENDFGGSPAAAVEAFLEAHEGPPSAEEVAALLRLMERAIERAASPTAPVRRSRAS